MPWLPLHRCPWATSVRAARGNERRRWRYASVGGKPPRRKDQCNRSALCRVFFSNGKRCGPTRVSTALARARSSSSRERAGASRTVSRGRFLQPEQHRQPVGFSLLQAATGPYRVGSSQVNPTRAGALTGILSRGRNDRGERTMTMIWLLLDGLGAVLAWLLNGVLALVDLISPGWDE